MFKQFLSFSVRLAVMNNNFQKQTNKLRDKKKIKLPLVKITDLDFKK